jgi:hypothetical protein
MAGLTASAFGARAACASRTATSPTSIYGPTATMWSVGRMSFTLRHYKDVWSAGKSAARGLRRSGYEACRTGNGGWAGSHPRRPTHSVRLCASLQVPVWFFSFDRVLQRQQEAALHLVNTTVRGTGQADRGQAGIDRLTLSVHLARRLIAQPRRQQAIASAMEAGGPPCGHVFLAALAALHSDVPTQLTRLVARPLAHLDRASSSKTSS